MAFGKTFSMAKSNIKEKSMEYLQIVTNRSTAEPQDTGRGVKTASQASCSCTSMSRMKEHPANLTFNIPATNHTLATPGTTNLNRKHALDFYAHPQKAEPKHPLHTPSTRRSKHLPQSRRNAFSSSIKDRSAAKQKQKKREKQELPTADKSTAKENQEIPHTDPLPLDNLKLEGLRNNPVSQLQKLADRAECINE